jgi:hypothetical protein
MGEAIADPAHSPTPDGLSNVRCASTSVNYSDRSSLRLFVQLRTPVQTKPMIKTTSAPSSKYFK